MIKPDAVERGLIGNILKDINGNDILDKDGNQILILKDCDYAGNCSKIGSRCLIDNEINHKSKIKSLSIELKKIKKETIPGKYKTSPIIGRIRVVNTYLQKIDSYLLKQETVKEYQMDLKNLVESYNGLIFQINQRSKEISD